MASARVRPCVIETHAALLTPAELGGDNAVIPAAGEWSRSVGVVLTATGGARVAGYRLLAFYP